jgi:hypothetical protein
MCFSANCCLSFQDARQLTSYHRGYYLTKDETDASGFHQITPHDLQIVSSSLFSRHENIRCVQGHFVAGLSIDGSGRAAVCVSDILFRGLPFFLFNGKFVTTAINELSK